MRLVERFTRFHFANWQLDALLFSFSSRNSGGIQDVEGSQALADLCKFASAQRV